MDPAIQELTEKNNILTFTISNINVSYANAIRRVILADIPTVVFRTFPHDKNDATFHINTGRLNNEILKQRLSSIPIHIKDLDIPLKDYVLEVDVKNNTDSLIYVTTADFKIKNTLTDTYLSNDQLKEIFPPDPISNDYIDFCRLRPRISDTIQVNILNFRAYLVLEPHLKVVHLTVYLIVVMNIHLTQLRLTKLELLSLLN